MCLEYKCRDEYVHLYSASIQLEVGLDITVVEIEEIGQHSKQQYKKAQEYKRQLNPSKPPKIVPLFPKPPDVHLYLVKMEYILT
mmetsp:Transcript_9459/g.14438  ORF Transcript_9459/g.14438 Transcript_9459/m.14438 type:complete len:84 (+) Transcript_9459:365-616(+)